MTHQPEFKKKYNPDIGKFTRQHNWSGDLEVFGEGITDKFKSLFGKKTKKQVKFAPPPPPKPTTTKKAGDKIVKMLSNKPINGTTKGKKGSTEKHEGGNQQ